MSSAISDPADRILTFFDLALASAPDRGFRGCQYADAADLTRRIRLIYVGALAGSELEHTMEPLHLGRALAAGFIPPA